MKPAKDQLDQWLSEGEITQKEYQEGLKLLEQSENSEESTDCRSLGHQIKINKHPVLNTALLYCMDCEKELNPVPKYD